MKDIQIKPILDLFFKMQISIFITQICYINTEGKMLALRKMLLKQRHVGETFSIRNTGHIFKCLLKILTCASMQNHHSWQITHTYISMNAFDLKASFF